MDLPTTSASTEASGIVAYVDKAETPTSVPGLSVADELSEGERDAAAQARAPRAIRPAWIGDGPSLSIGYVEDNETKYALQFMQVVDVDRAVVDGSAGQEAFDEHGLVRDSRV